MIFYVFLQILPITYLTSTYYLPTLFQLFKWMKCSNLSAFHLNNNNRQRYKNAFFLLKKLSYHVAKCQQGFVFLLSFQTWYHTYRRYLINIPRSEVKALKDYLLLKAIVKDASSFSTKLGNFMKRLHRESFRQNYRNNSLNCVG